MIMTHSDEQNSRLFSRKALASFLGVSLASLDRWRADPRRNFPKPVQRFLPILRWRRAEIDAWISCNGKES
jgi:predicted DNA-binding transcriptional regulator AlpA